MIIATVSFALLISGCGGTVAEESASSTNSTYVQQTSSWFKQLIPELVQEVSGRYKNPQDKYEYIELDRNGKFTYYGRTKDEISRQMGTEYYRMNGVWAVGFGQDFSEENQKESLSQRGRMGIITTPSANASIFQMPIFLWDHGRLRRDTDFQNFWGKQ